MTFSDALDAINSGKTVYSESAPKKILGRHGLALTYSDAVCTIETLCQLSKLDDFVLVGDKPNRAKAAQWLKDNLVNTEPSPPAKNWCL